MLSFDLLQVFHLRIISKSSLHLQILCSSAGSVIGPLLWNVYYDDVFRIQMPGGMTLVGYTDDLGMVAVAKTGTMLTNNINTAVVHLTEWLKGRHLTIAPEKPEVVLLAGRRKLSQVWIRVEGRHIDSSRSLK